MDGRPTAPGPGGTGAEVSAVPWWHRAVIYQVYIRSFADGDGDGIGDLAGLRNRLPYLRVLGVDAVWINPWYASPQVDGGYDIEDYRRIDPVLGDLDQACAFIKEAHGYGLRVLVDLVPNHTSERHAWFREALAAGPGSPARARYHFRPGRGPGGAQPPNNWPSIFGGPAWTRVPDGEWYLHLFASAQPDLNWSSPEVRAEFAEILRFWLDRGVDGFRIDVAHGLTKDPGYPDIAGVEHGILDSSYGTGHPFFDRDETLGIYEDWRRIADAYPGERLFVAEAWVSPPERLGRYLAPGRLHTAFTFSLLGAQWDAAQLRARIENSLGELAPIGAPPAWALSNHDVVRLVTRYGRARTSLEDARRLSGTSVDLQLGAQRARAVALLELALPGSAYVYQGDELGLEEVEDIPEHRLTDPSRNLPGGAPVRDGCRVPLPWRGEEPPFGFSSAGSGAEPWLPQPPSWKGQTAAVQQLRTGSTLNLYRSALSIRRTRRGLREQTLAWLDAGPGVLAFRRGADTAVLVNVDAEPCPLPPHRRVLLASGPLAGDALPCDTAVWLAL